MFLSTKNKDCAMGWKHKAEWTVITTYDVCRYCMLALHGCGSGNSMYIGLYLNKIGRVYLPRHGSHKAIKVRWITRDGANNS